MLVKKSQSQHQRNKSIIIKRAGIAPWVGVIGLGILIQGLKGISNCIQQDLNTGKCSICYKSSPATNGTLCEGLPNSQKACEVLERLATTSKLTCLRCASDHFRYKGKCYSRSGKEGFSGCLSYFSEKSGGSELFCDECSGGTPSSDLKSCSIWSGKYQQNCLNQGRKAVGGEVFCSLCRPGYTYNTVSKTCVLSSIEGCTSSQTSICLSCKVGEGYFPEGTVKTTYHQKVQKSTFCRSSTNVKPTWILSDDWDAEKEPKISDLGLQDAIKIKDLANSSFTIKNYADIKDGYAVLSTDGKVYYKNNNKKGEPGFILSTLNTVNNTQNSLLSCFYLKQVCLILNTPTSGSGEQKVSLFSLSTNYLRGVVYTNDLLQKDSIITQMITLIKSTYVILGFNSNSDKELGSPDALVRFDYLNTSKQFKYAIPHQNSSFRCLNLLYIEYSNYFVGSFNNGGGVLLYDLTQSNPFPSRVMKEGSNHQHLAYAKLTRVLLMSESQKQKIFGYSMIGKRVYHITVKAPIYGLAAYPESDFFLVSLFEKKKSSWILDIYNLKGVVHRFGLGSKASSLVMSDFFGGPLVKERNFILRFSYTGRHVNPSCSVTTDFSFSIVGCPQCSDLSVVLEKGFCELAASEFDLEKYLRTSIPSLPSNFEGKNHYIEVKPGKNKPSAGYLDKILRTKNMLMIGSFAVSLLIIGIAVVLFIAACAKPNQKLKLNFLAVGFLSSIPVILGCGVSMSFVEREEGVLEQRLVLVGIQLIVGLAVFGWLLWKYTTRDNLRKMIAFFIPSLAFFYLITISLILISDIENLLVFLFCIVWNILELGGLAFPFILFYKNNCLGKVTTILQVLFTFGNITFGVAAVGLDEIMIILLCFSIIVGITHIILLSTFEMSDKCNKYGEDAEIQELELVLKGAYLMFLGFKYFSFTLCITTRPMASK